MDCACADKALPYLDFSAACAADEYKSRATKLATAQCKSWRRYYPKSATVHHKIFELAVAA